MLVRYNKNQKLNTFPVIAFQTAHFQHHGELPHQQALLGQKPASTTSLCIINKKRDLMCFMWYLSALLPVFTVYLGTISFGTKSSTTSRVHSVHKKKKSSAVHLHKVHVLWCCRCRGAGSQIWDDAKPGLGAEITGVLLSILKYASKQQTPGSPRVKETWRDWPEPLLLRKTSLLQSQFINMNHSNQKCMKEWWIPAQNYGKPCVIESISLISDCLKPN